MPGLLNVWDWVGGVIEVPETDYHYPNGALEEDNSYRDLIGPMVTPMNWDGDWPILENKLEKLTNWCHRVMVTFERLVRAELPLRFAWIIQLEAASGFTHAHVYARAELIAPATITRALAGAVKRANSAVGLPAACARFKPCKTPRGQIKVFTQDWIEDYLLGKVPPEAIWAETSNEGWLDCILSVGARERRRRTPATGRPQPPDSPGEGPSGGAARKTRQLQILPGEKGVSAPVVITTAAKRFKELVNFLFVNDIYTEETWSEVDRDSLLTYQSSQTLNWQKKAALAAARKQCIQEKTLVHFWENPRNAEPVTDMKQNRIWELLRFQGYNPEVVGAMLMAWANRQTGKKNAVWFFGPATTGKTNLAAALVKAAPIWGCVNQTNESFPFNDAADKSVLWWEEAVMKRKMVETAKMILGGQAVRVDQKNKGSVVVTGTPVIITSNVDVTVTVDGNVDDYSHRQPLLDRIIKLTFSRRLRPDFGLIQAGEVAGFFRNCRALYLSRKWDTDCLAGCYFEEENEPLSDVSGLSGFPDVTDEIDSDTEASDSRSNSSSSSSEGAGAMSAGGLQQRPADESERDGFCSPRATSTPLRAEEAATPRRSRKRKRADLGGGLVESSVRRTLVGDSFLSCLSNTDFCLTPKRDKNCTDPFLHLFGGCVCNDGDMGRPSFCGQKDSGNPAQKVSPVHEDNGRPSREGSEKRGSGRSSR